MTSLPFVATSRPGGAQGGRVAAVRDWLERVSAGLSQRLPPPPFMGPLARVEEQLVDALLAEQLDAIVAARARSTDPYNDSGAAGMDTAVAEALADRLVTTLRQRMECLPWDRPVLALTARLDQALPTDEGEYMDDKRVARATRDALVRTLDKQTHRAGDYLVLAHLLAPLLDSLGAHLKTPATVLDLGSGPGGFPVAVARRLGARSDVQVVATDIDDQYLDLARAIAEAEGVLSRMQFQRLDALRLRDELRGWRPEIITCTRSLHHFGVRGTVRVLSQALACAAHGVLFVDISRSISRMLMATGAGVGSCNWRFLHDAVLSVRKSFTPGELRLICACVPGAEALEIFYAAPAYLVARGAVPTTTSGATER